MGWAEFHGEPELTVQKRESILGEKTSLRTRAGRGMDEVCLKDCD